MNLNTAYHTNRIKYVRRKGNSALLTNCDLMEELIR